MVPVNIKDGSSDQFGTVRNINMALNGVQLSSEYLTTTDSDMLAEAVGVIKPGTTLRELEAENERPSRQSGVARVSTSIKLPVTNKITPPLVTPLVDDGISMEEALTKIMDGMGEQWIVWLWVRIV